MNPLRRALGWRHWIPVLSVLAVLSLIMSTYSVAKYTQAQSARERDRIASDIQGCERGNDLREQIKIIGNAQEALVDGILDAIFAYTGQGDPAREARLQPLRDQLLPLFVTYEAAVAEVTTTDCARAVPGA